MKVPTYTNTLELLQTTIRDIQVDRNGNMYIQDEDGWIEKRDAMQRLVWRAELGTDLFGLVGNDSYIITYDHLQHKYYAADTGKLVASPKLDYTSFDRDELPNDTKGGFYAPEKTNPNGPQAMESSSSMRRARLSGTIKFASVDTRLFES
jgi:hypothetical protein